jgi:lipopolysaccharide/colanic/teichoic acid biosynthesis glycosyltransferase
MYKSIIKPILDFIFSFVSLIFLSPLFIIIYIILFFVNQGKSFFVQMRPGKNEKIFKLIKFKTMNDNVDLEGNLLPDEKRLTKIGKFLRKTSLDEIPQLLNVIKGDMSLVGPRPLLVEYLPLYDNFQKRRHEVKPGITGWAQVNGRNAISWKKKFELDVWYVDNVSFWLDLKIIFLTFLRVAKREGVSSSTYVTMEKFNGNN